MPMFINVALNIPADKLFTYEVPSNLQSLIAVGKRVFVPFGNRKRTGFITGINASSPVEKTKQVSEILDEEPLFDEQDLRFYNWTADYFMYPLGKTLAEIIPTGSEKKDFLWIIPKIVPSDLILRPAQKKIMEILQQYPQGITPASLGKLAGIKNITPAIYGLHLAGLVQIDNRQRNHLAPHREKIVTLGCRHDSESNLTEKQETLLAFIRERGSVALNDLIRESGVSRAIVRRMQSKGIIRLTENEKIRQLDIESSVNSAKINAPLNNYQQKALLSICEHLEKKTFTPILLHGVTGSGKTEVYLQAIDQVLKNGGTAVYLVPEIALTPQLIARIQERFDQKQIAVLHSGIAETIRYDQWRQIRRGRIRLVIGARSALFAPIPDLRLIIVDEEHDSSYKQDERLCYHARDLAVVKARFHSAVLVLGSATPGIRSYYNARNKKYFFLEIPDRVENKPLPAVEVIDMKDGADAASGIPFLSSPLIAAIKETLDRKEQVLLFLNRRGFDTFLVCADCGYNFRCPNCAVSLKNHKSEGMIKCHYCNYTQKALPVCPSCGGGRILSYGVGTQKLEAEIKKLFPESRTERMDSDAAANKVTREEILYRLQRREIDILVGTQMITKGHDFPFITLVGVISADTVLNMPDFRAAEKTFQQLIQVAGRGGRGSSPGRVLIQTFNPGHYALRHVRNHDYESFYAEEIVLRKDLKYPPFSRMINLRLSATQKETLTAEADLLGKKAKRLAARQGNIVEIFGPAESPLAKIQGRWRSQLLFKSENAAALHRLVRNIISPKGKNTIRITIDVDPENFM